MVKLLTTITNALSRWTHKVTLKYTLCVCVCVCVCVCGICVCYVMEHAVKQEKERC